MLDVPLALALAGGLVATVNPCGFAMLPAYLSFFIALDDGAQPSTATAVLRALRVGLVVSTGFLIVFGVAGLLLTTGAQAVVTALPWIALIVGAGLVLLGGWLVSGRTLPITVPGPKQGVHGRKPLALLGFGIAYALASLSCALPVFLAVVAGTLVRANLGQGLVIFAVYAAGMALPLLGLSVALALGRGAALRRLRSFSRHANRMAGGLLFVAGSYIVFFWTLSLAAGDRATPRLIQVVDSLSSRLTNALGSRPVVTGLVLVAALGLSLAYGLLARRRSASATRRPTSK